MNFNAMFSMILLVNALLLSIGETGYAQYSDTGHATIHQTQSLLHRWDELKIDSSCKEFQRGKEYAREGKLRAAIREFKKGLIHNRSYSLFDLGVVSSAESRFTQALSYFRDSYTAQKDSICLKQIKNTERLIREHKRFIEERRKQR